jgi:hypothetical protein
MPNSRKENERPAWSLGTPSPWLTEITPSPWLTEMTRVARNGQPRAAAVWGSPGQGAGVP